MNHRMIRCAVSVTLLLFTLIGIAAISEKQNVFAEDSKAPENMVLVPGGKFLYGEDKKETSLKTFYIDKYEVTNEDYKKIKTEHAFPSKEGKYPVREISWFDAEEYCKGTGKRLPTEEEREKAA
ncbi:MAG: SUMF1/EgtB/PvdO family nonheme iron enzyme, partial [Nitrospirae bacterium]|nr:SUMF1/EgtB/PvdO family nonheme iron enzyme [Nitrospirota bacterium]